jgi:hypothetical protein
MKSQIKNLRLNHKNYFSKENNYISCSKLKTFVKDKALYKRKYIDWSVDQEKTDSLIIGSAVDCLLTATKAKFDKEFVVVDRRSSKSDETRIQINSTMLEKIEAIVKSVKRQDIWKNLKQKEWKKQVILTDDELGICGMLDFLYIDKHLEKAIILDLKTSNTIDPRKYYFLSYDYNYILQLAFYSTLVYKNYPEVKSIDCYHLAVEKDADDLYNCAVFQFDKQLIQNETIRMFKELEELRNEKDFAPKSVGFKDKILISSLT